MDSGNSVDTLADEGNLRTMMTGIAGWCLSSNRLVEEILRKVN